MTTSPNNIIDNPDKRLYHKTSLVQRTTAFKKNSMRSSSSSSLSPSTKERPNLIKHLSMDVGSGSFYQSEAGSSTEACPLVGAAYDNDNYNTTVDDWIDFAREPLVCCAFFLLGWFGPKTLLPSEEHIQSQSVPYQETAAGDVILDFDLNHEYVDPPAVPSSMLVHTCVWFPLLLLVGLGMWQKNAIDLRSSVSSFLTAVGCSEGWTQLLKLFVKRKRPNFYQLCDFDVVLKKCQAPLSRLRESRLSFPSGHTSLSFCAMTFLVWYFLGKVGLARPTKAEARRRVLALLSCLVPWSFSTFVSATRLADHWHHPADVLAGCLLGSTCATIVYHLWYPHVLALTAGIPYAALNKNHDDNNNDKYDDVDMI